MVQGLHPKIFADRHDRVNAIVAIDLILTFGIYIRVRPVLPKAFMPFVRHWRCELAAISAEIDRVLKNYVIQTRLVTSHSRCGALWKLRSRLPNVTGGNPTVGMYRSRSTSSLPVHTERYNLRTFSTYPEFLTSTLLQVCIVSCTNV